MKLKLVVASMSVLGLISFPVFADTTTATTVTTATTADNNTQTATQPKHKHHHHYYHHHHHKAMAPQTVAAVERHDYKDMGALPVETCPVVNNYTMMLDFMSQNVGRAKPTVHCMDPISFAGGMNFDSHWGSRDIGYMGENQRRLALNDAYLNVYGNVNEWVKAFASLSYSGFNGVSSITSTRLAGIYSNAYTNDKLTLEQGIITFSNTDVTPIFVRVGKMFADFGRYAIHPITESLTQTMSESLNTAAQVGFMTQMGFSGSLYTFNNDLKKVTNGHTQNNFGVSLGFAQPNDQLGYDLGIGYLNDFTGVNDVGYAVGKYNGSSGAQSGVGGTYQKRISAGNFYGDLNSGPFTVGVRYVSALSTFNSADLGNKASPVVSTGGAKPWSADITGGYGFNGWGKDQNVYLGYQASGNAVNLLMPKSRWTAGYGIDVWKNTNLGLQVNHDNAYSQGTGGTGNSSNTIAARAAVKFG